RGTPVTGKAILESPVVTAGTDQGTMGLRAFAGVSPASKTIEVEEGSQGTSDLGRRRRSMARSLVIVESPGKAKTINKYLGRNYTVKASYGHVMDLPKKIGRA